VAAFYDDDKSTWGKAFCDVTVAGPISAISDSAVSHAIIGIGDNAARKRVADQLDLEWVTVVHPFSWVHPDVELGPGTLVCAGAIVQPGAKVGAHVLLNTKASVDHDTCVGDYVHIAVAHLAGGASVDEGAFLALGSTVLPGVHVGAWATVGAGSVVTKNVRPGTTVVGVPARELHCSR
jgi:sugar O-acyltransferase (sialic acid O-acetyltransferase NeuD family)